MKGNYNTLLIVAIDAENQYDQETKQFQVQHGNKTRLALGQAGINPNVETANNDVNMLDALNDSQLSFGDKTRLVMVQNDVTNQDVINNDVINTHDNLGFLQDEGLLRIEDGTTHSGLGPTGLSEGIRTRLALNDDVMQRHNNSDDTTTRLSINNDVTAPQAEGTKTRLALTDDVIPHHSNSDNANGTYIRAAGKNSINDVGTNRNDVTIVSSEGKTTLDVDSNGIQDGVTRFVVKQ